MWRDILLAILQGLDAAIMAYLGVHVTLHPTEDGRVRMWYKMGFVACSVIQVVLIVTQTMRNAQTQSAIRNQLTTIQHNTEKPPNVSVTVPQTQVTINPPKPHEHTHIQFFNPSILSDEPAYPFKVDRPVKFNVGYFNAGSYPATILTTLSANINIVNQNEIPNMVENFKKHGPKFEPSEHMLLVPGIDFQIFRTIVGSPLSSRDVNDLDNLYKSICIISAIEWKDNTGHYETDSCMCIDPLHNPSVPAWGLCLNREIQLR